MTTHKDFVSEKYRLECIDRIRTNQIALFTRLQWKEDSLLSELEMELPIMQRVAINEIYRRKETKTIVYRLSVPECSVVLKIYHIGQFKSTGPNEATNYEIEIRYLKLFEELVQKSVLPHYALAVGHAVLTTNQIRSLLPKDLVVENANYMCLLGECGDTSLWKLLQKQTLSDYCLGALILQVVLALAIAQDLFPSWRHNDLHAGNILIQALHVKQGHVRYDMHGEHFYLNVGACPFRSLLWDMYYASTALSDTRGIPYLVPAKRELFHDPHSHNTRICHNQYFDLHRFFDAILFVLSSPGAKTQTSTELRQLIEHVVPFELQCMPKNLSHQEKMSLRIWEIQHVTPKLLLNHPYFAKYRAEPQDPYVLLRKYKHPP